ncbi:MAG: glutathione S-transferase family protein [Pseudomonadota bacterium]
MSDITLWGGGTSRTFRAHWMLHELDLPYEKHLIASRTGETQTSEFTKLNPRQKIPVLQDGDLTIAESGAIMNYLATNYGEETNLIPPEKSKSRALYDQWCFFIAMELDAHTLYVMRKHRDLAQLYGEAPKAIDAAIEGFNKQVAVAELELSRVDGPYLLGEHFTGADMFLSTCLEWAHLYGITVSSSFNDYRERLKSRPAYQTAFKLNFSVNPGM